MNEDVRLVLFMAAAAGHEFTFRGVSAGMDAIQHPLSDSALINALDSALQAHILEETNDGYAFRHPLFRAALHEQLSKHRRAHLHATFAPAPRNSGPDLREEGDNPPIPKQDSTTELELELERAGSLPPEQAARIYGYLVDRLDGLGRALDSARVRQKLAASLMAMAKYDRALKVLLQAEEIYLKKDDQTGLQYTRSQVDLVSFLSGTPDTQAS
jgi:hypothetical protein